MSTDNSEGPDAGLEVELRQRVLEAIPDIDLDTAAIYRRGRQLRNRRRAAISAGALASVVLVGVIAWTAAFRPLTPVPPAGTGESESSQSVSASPSETTSYPNQEPTDDPTGPNADASDATGPGDDGVRTPQLETADLEAFASQQGLAIERAYAEGNMVDVAMRLQDGSAIVVTVTAASAEQTAQALEAATSGRDYQQSDVGDVVVYQQSSDNPGAPVHWLLVAGRDGTELISIQANPAGSEADGNQVPPATIRLVEDELILYAMSGSNV